MATSLSTAAPPGAQNSPNMPQGPWGGSATMQSPNLPAHPRGPGARADTTSSFASRSLPPAEGSIPQQLNGIHHPPPTAPSPQNVTPTHPPASHSPFLPQFTQRHPSQDASANAPQQHSKAPAGLIRSDTGPGTQPATDKSHTEQYTVIADAIKSADPSILRQAVRDHWDACLLGSDYNLAFFVRFSFHFFVSLR